ncbi:MAG: phosphoribosylglycinamide formyltransferase [Candidatus Omnitrophota bacterium]
MNIAVLCSGNGSNFQAIVDAKKKGIFKPEIALMVCDNPDAYAVKRAEKEGIKTFIAERKNFPSKIEFEQSIIAKLKEHDIGLICLAGYMRLLSGDFIAKYKNKILNIHPALLPSFKGAHAIKDALDHGVKITGVTVHFVTEDMDAGPIILQEPVNVQENDTEDTLADRIHKVEHRLYPEAIKLFTGKRLSTIGRKIKILAAVTIFLSVFSFESKAMYGSDLIFSPVLTKVTVPVYLKEELRPITGLDIKALKEKDVIKKPVAQDPKIYNKLELLSFKLYDIEEIIYSDSGSSKSYDPSIDAEQLITKEEIENMRIKSSVKAAHTLAEVMDSVNFKLAYSGINNLVETAKNLIKFREYVGEKYHLHFKVDKDEALFRYKKRF